VEDILGKNAGNDGIPMGTFAYKCCFDGIGGWRNLADDKGHDFAPKKGKNGKIDPDQLDVVIFGLTMPQRAELANRVHMASMITEEEEKNLSSPPIGQKES
jgi:hypothetical protein